jgi:DNA-binding LacI/PurR family transcriptional regulator
MFGAVEHLVKHSHHKVAFLTTDDASQFDLVQRRHEFANAFKASQLSTSAHNIVTAQGEMTGVAHRLTALEVTAVVCATGSLANEVWTALEEAGLHVPEDISLVSVDDWPTFARRELTTVAFSFGEVGSAAADTLVAQLRGEKASDCCRIVPVRLCECDSVRTL